MSESKIMKTLNGYAVYDEAAHREIETLKGASPGLVFDTVTDMAAYVAEHSAELRIGQDLYIRQADVPDYWWDGTQAIPVETDMTEIRKEMENLSEAIADNKNNIEKLIEVNSKRLIQGNEYDWTRGYFDANGHFNSAYYYRIAIKQWFAVEPGETYRFESNSTDKLLIRGYRGTTGYDFVETLVALESSKTITIPESINHITITLSRGEDGGDSIATVNQMLADADAGLINPTVTRLFVSNSADSSQFVRTVNGISPDENGNVEIANLQISGLTTAQVNALDGMFKIASFTKDPTAEYTAFKAAFGIEGGGEVEPDEPETPTKTLTSISATYSGGDVAVGTALSDLTGIVITATYSDGSTENVTGYTLSGEIAEGSNTITVSYGGKTTTFTVTGIAESVGENNGWVEGEAYELIWNDGYRIFSDGAVQESSGMSISDYIPVLGVDVVTVTEAYPNYGFATYDNDKNLIQMYSSMSVTEPNPISHDVAYIRINANTSKKESVVVTPHTYDVLTENTVWVAEKKYVLPFDGLGSISDTGVDDESQNSFRTGYSLCYGATTLYITPYVTSGTNRKAVFFYDESKNFVSSTGWGANYTVEVPQGVKYFRVSGYYIGSTKSTSNPWVYLV